MDTFWLVLGLVWVWLLGFLTGWDTYDNDLSKEIRRFAPTRTEWHSVETAGHKFNRQ